MNMWQSVPKIEALPIWFAETTLLAAVLAIVACLGSRSRRLGPSARHTLWLAVLVRLMIPPVVHWPWARDIQLPAISTQGQIQEPTKEAEPSAMRLSAAPLSLRVTSRPIVEPPPAPPIEFSSVSPADEGAAAVSIFEPSEIFAPLMDEPAITAAIPEPIENFHATIEEPSEVVKTGTRTVGVYLLWACWLLGSLVLAVFQVSRILAFRRRLKPERTLAAPDWLVEETRRVAELLRVRPPSIQTVPGLSSPMLWCLGRPVLLVPRHLLDSLDVSRWRGILAHELAHLRRGDPWVSRLELVAGLVWWWNPIYWIARRRLDAEAELACDAWVVSLLPDDRLTYAESLVRVCSGPSPVPSTRIGIPALGVSGAGQFFERRLTMILRDSVSCRTSAWSALAAALLLLVSAPAWTLATPPAAEVESLDDENPAVITFESTADTDSDEADDTERAAQHREKAKADKEKAKADKEKAAKDKVIRLLRQKYVPTPLAVPVAAVVPVAPVPPIPPVDSVAPAAVTIKGPDGTTVTADAITLKGAGGVTIPGREGTKARLFAAKSVKPKAKAKTRDAEDTAELAEQKSEQAAAEFEAKMEEFEAKMEHFAEDVVKKALGPDFEKRMEAIGKEMEKKYGPGSDFEKAMERIGKEMEKKYGPGSDFEKMMKSMGKDIEKQFGPGSEFEKTIKKQAAEAKEQALRAAHEAKKVAEQNARKQKAESIERKEKAEAAENKEKAELDETNTKLSKAKAAQDAKVREKANAERQVAQAKARAQARVRTREKRIKAIEERLKSLMVELNQLEKEGQEPEE